MIKYRCDEVYGNHILDILDVITYEVMTLGNSDILIYLNEHYLRGKLKEMTNSFILELENNGFIDDISEEDFKIYLKEILKILRTNYDVNLKYCLWLTDKKIVKDFYCKNLSNFKILGFETSNFILSDLGLDGQLYGYEEIPKHKEELYYEY